jgi:hypothetical protein
MVSLSSIYPKLFTGFTTTATNVPTPTVAPTLSTNASSPAKVGQTITVNAVSCRLLSGKTVLDLDNLEVEWVIVHVKIVNQINQDYDYGQGDFNIISGTGNATGSSYTLPSTYNGTQIEDATLVPGGSVTGDIIFQAQVGDHKAELSWKPSVFGNTTDNVWELGL